MPRKALVIRTLLWVSLLFPLAAGGFLLGAAVADDDAETARLRSEARGARDRIAALERQRDVLRADRNQLETRLAARAPRAICPETYVSTGDVDLLPNFEVDYRCGWHALHDARPTAVGEERPGTLVSLTLFSRLPIRLGAGGSAATIELSDWTDDPVVDGEGLPPLSTWLADERKTFASPPSETSLEAGDATTIRRLSGTAQLGAGDTAILTVLLWEYEDARAARHVVRVVAVDPSRQVDEAIARLGRSFRVRQP